MRFRIGPTVKRRLFDFAAAGSQLLFHAVCVLWACDVRHESIDAIEWEHYFPPQKGRYCSWEVMASAYSGTLRVDVTRDRYGTAYLDTLSSAQRTFWDTARPTGSRLRVWGGLATLAWEHHPPGFDADHYVRWRKPDRYTDHWGFAVRTWLPTLLLTVLPAAWVCRHFKPRRANAAE